MKTRADAWTESQKLAFENVPALLRDIDLAARSLIHGSETR